MCASKVLAVCHSPAPNLLSSSGEQGVSRFYFLLNSILIDWCVCLRQSLQGKNWKLLPHIHLCIISEYNSCLCRIQRLCEWHEMNKTQDIKAKPKNRRNSHTSDVTEDLLWHTTLENISLCENNLYDVQLVN